MYKNIKTVSFTGREMVHALLDNGRIACGHDAYSKIETDEPISRKACLNNKKLNPGKDKNMLDK